jgi:hypothetical protein
MHPMRNPSTLVAAGIALLLVGIPCAVAVWLSSRSSDREVHPAELADLIDRADRVVIRQEPGDVSPVLYESSDRRDLDSLKAALQVERPDRFEHCMCNGTPAIYLYAGGRELGRVTNHHAKRVRCSLWASDARLPSPEPLLKWFDDRKLPGPRAEYVDGLRREAEWRRGEERWVEAMPLSLRPHWPSARSLDPELGPLRAALAQEVPDRGDRVRALFAWFGSGAGPWSGFPAYEGVAENLLLDYPTAELLAAVQGRELSVEQTEGVARLFAGWTFSQRRPGDIRLLPADLKARLLTHSLASPNEDKRGRARSAFEPK